VSKRSGLGKRMTITHTERSERRPITARNSEVDTKTRLLDAAERLFSNKGFEAVSHRDIASAAAVNLAAVNYHFGSKDQLVRAVIKRRVDSLNARRLAALARAERRAGSKPVPTDSILEAFLGPAVENPNGHFQGCLCIGPATNQYRDFFIGLMTPVVDRFTSALQRSLPSRSHEDCQWFMMFSLAIPSLVLQDPRVLQGASQSVWNRSEARMVTRRIVQLVCGGLNGSSSHFWSMRPR
jgi:AcrR family transcriptional regulator